MKKDRFITLRISPWDMLPSMAEDELAQAVVDQLSQASGPSYSISYHKFSTCKYMIGGNELNLQIYTILVYFEHEHEESLFWLRGSEVLKRIKFIKNDENCI